MPGGPQGTTTQTDSSAGRDFAGGNINHNITNINGGTIGSAAWINTIFELSKKYLDEREQGDGISQPLISKLEHYSSPAASDAVSEVIGLEEKLNRGGVSYLYDFAVSVKEMFTKHLARNQFSKSAQRIYAILLAETFTRFQHHVYPSIVEGKSHQEVMGLMQEHVVNHLQERLGLHNVLEIDEDEICGMLYFLTGNCHLKWH